MVKLMKLCLTDNSTRIDSQTGKYLMEKAAKTTNR
jgi:hypothetical protein